MPVTISLTPSGSGGRTTQSAVIAVMAASNDDGYDLANAPSLTPYIAIANLIVNQLAACAMAKGVTYSTADLTTFETWLAAHAYKMSDQVYASKNTNGTSASFQSMIGKNLEGTKYGQMALAADGTGCLMAMSSGNRARAAWLGKTASEALDWEERN